MYWGNGTLQYAKLKEDMISLSGGISTVALSGVTEGPWLYKRDSTYYMIYAGMGGGTEKISYATSNSPTGPWSAKGDIMDAGRTITNHPGIVDFKGHSYFFYHNSALPGGNDFKRSVCVQDFSYRNDGNIPKLSMDGEGPEGIARLNPFEARVSASTGNASIELHLDSKDGTSLGTCDVSGQTNWTTVTCDVSGGSGTHDLFLVFSGNGDELFKFNWWKFE